MPALEAHESDPVQIEQLVQSLSALHSAEKTVIELIAAGDAAVPALRRFLFTREPSGIYEPRCWAVRALARIGAHDVLVNFLESDHELSDPVERLGEAAVMNTAARALSGIASEEVCRVLLKVAQRRPLPGVIEVLGESGSQEVVPILIRALEDDVARGAAQDALRRFGAAVGHALCEAATRQRPPGNESPSSARRRRSAIRLLRETGLAVAFWEQLRHLIDDADDHVTAIACMVAMDCGTTAEKQRAARDLVRLLATDDWLLRSEIERALAEHFEISGDAIADALSHDPDATPLRVRRALARVLKRTDVQREA